MSRTYAKPGSHQRKSSTIIFPVEEMVCDEPEEALQQVIRIARKPMIMRTEYEAQILKNSLRSIKFFRDQFESHYEDMLDDVCEHAKLIMMLNKEVVIHQDTSGDTFYIIIKGSIKVVRKVTTLIGQAKNKKGKLKDNYVEQVKVLTTLGNGDTFGELSLLENKPRAATLYCDSDTFLLVLDKQAFDRIIATKAKRQFTHQLEKLRDNSILKELSINSVKVLFLTMERQSFTYGDWVYKYHDPSDAIYFIAEGEFKTQQEVCESTTTTETPDEMMMQRPRRELFDVKIAGVNECIGLEDFIRDAPHTSLAVCHSQEGVVFKLDRNDYRRLEQRYPDICQIMVTVAQEKTEYYSTISRVISETKKNLTSEAAVTAVLSTTYSASTKNLRKIITDDHNMSFISRDQITLNEDNDIMMKFSPFFQIEAVTQPFQVNSIDQIHKQRIQSAGYRTMSPPNKTLTQQSQRAQSALVLFAPKVSPDRMKTSDHMTTTQTNIKRKRTKIKVKTISKQEALQQKMQIFLQLNQEKIECISKNTRAQQLQYRESKPYIKNYQDKHVLQLIEDLKQHSTKHVDEVYVRPSTGRPAQLFHSVTPISRTMRSKQLSMLRIGVDDTSKTIHNYSRQRGIATLRLKLVSSMDIAQMPLKYNSTLIKGLGQWGHPRSTKNSFVMRSFI